MHFDVVDNADGDEETWDDVMDDLEDVWMREPSELAGLPDDPGPSTSARVIATSTWAEARAQVTAGTAVILDVRSDMETAAQ